MNESTHRAPAEHREVRPWGEFRQFIHNEPCTVKIISVNPGAKLSLQSHARRSEMWVVLDEGVLVEIDGAELEPTVGSTIFIPVGSRHRLSARGGLDAAPRILEIGLGEFDEDDIKRYEDDYGRA